MPFEVFINNSDMSRYIELQTHAQEVGFTQDLFESTEEMERLRKLYHFRKQWFDALVRYFLNNSNEWESLTELLWATEIIQERSTCLDCETDRRVWAKITAGASETRICLNCSAAENRVVL